MFDALEAVSLAALLTDEEKEKRRKTMNEMYVSPILKNLIGKECIISTEQLDSERCNVLDVDAEFIMIKIHGKKGDVTYIERIDSIEEIQLL